MELENGVHQLETLLESTVDKSFDKFEIYTLRNILTIPDDLAPWMRLAHYEVCQSLLERRRIQRYRIVQLTDSTGHRAPHPIIRPNTRVHPLAPAQTPRDPKIEPRAPFHPHPQHKPHHPTQYPTLSSHKRK